MEAKAIKKTQYFPSFRLSRALSSTSFSSLQLLASASCSSPQCSKEASSSLVSTLPREVFEDQSAHENSLWGLILRSSREHLVLKIGQHDQHEVPSAGIKRRGLIFACT